MRYGKVYTEKSFWHKTRQVAKKAGAKVIYSALVLYYTTRRPETPKWAKTAIYGALGYFISLIDLIPDITPFVGYADDMVVLTLALTVCAAYINEDVKQNAREKMYSWFGDGMLGQIGETEMSEK